MADDRTLRPRLEEVLRVTADALGAWMARRLDVWPPDRRGNVQPHDPSYLIDTVLQHRADAFPEFLIAGHVGALYRLREARNSWAHFEFLDPAALESASAAAETVLRVVGSPVVAAFDEPAIVRPPAPSGHRRSRSLEFRNEQWDRRFAEHCAPINELVDELIIEAGSRWMPYGAPYHGGIHSEALLLFQDPGKMTNQVNGGSGFIGCENDDPSAELLAMCLDTAGIDQTQVMPWNAYPWYLPEQGGVSARLRREGLDPLQRVIARLPQLHTVISCGAVAHDSWSRFSDVYPAVASRVRHLETFHTSGRGITNGGRQKKTVGVDHVVATLRASMQARDSRR